MEEWQEETTISPICCLPQTMQGTQQDVQEGSLSGVENTAHHHKQHLPLGGSIILRGSYSYWTRSPKTPQFVSKFHLGVSVCNHDCLSCLSLCCNLCRVYPTSFLLTHIDSHQHPLQPSKDKQQMFKFCLCDPF